MARTIDSTCPSRKTRYKSPTVGEITPLLIDFWFWLALVFFWLIGALFVHKTRSRETRLQRVQHVAPMYLGFILIFVKRNSGLLDYRLYSNNSVAWFGTLLTLAGVLFAMWARVIIGRNWSGIVTLKQGHTLIREGPYQFTRHPIYTGFIAGAIGSALSAARIDAWIGVAIIIVAFFFKLRREESLMIGEFKEEYESYKRQVPALFPLPWFSFSANQPIQSEAFQHAAIQSDRYRIIGILCVCAAFGFLDIAMALANTQGRWRFMMYFSWWSILAAYEFILLLIANRARRRGKPMRTWIWALNTILECLLPSLAIMGMTADKAYLGPFRALVASTTGIYFLLIILSTLRLSPLLCILAGATSAAGYFAVYQFTLWVAPLSDYRDFMPARTFSMTTLVLAGAGLVAAAVAYQIRQHVVAALAEAETRRALDRIEYDLNIARSIQIDLLPKKSPDVAGYDIAGWSEPADKTGGDYYDWIALPASKLMITIADATGHGLGPALLIAACRAYFRAIAQHADPLERIVKQVDALITADVPAGRFITAAVAILDPINHQLQLYSAGHAPLYFFRAASNEVLRFEADQTPLGVGLGSDPDLKARVLEFAAGDSLILVTDGFFECSNRSGEMLGTSRLADFICGAQQYPADELIDALHQHVVRFSNGLPQTDDMTAVVIKRQPI